MISIHFVEASQQMRKIQEATLCGYFHGHSHRSTETESQRNKDEKDEQNQVGLYEHKAITKYGQNVYWYARTEDVPEGFSFYLAHEFFDALPIHKFVRTKDGDWREILVDIDPSKDAATENVLRFVQAKFATPAVQFIPKEINDDADRRGIELSPKTGVLIEHISDRIDKWGGCALIADYGRNAPAEDSFRAFKNHQLHEVLEEPGNADLTADVDFSYLRNHCSEHTISYGPVSQRDFLLSLGIDVRHKKLWENCTDEAVKSEIELAYKKLTDEDKMGLRFQFFSIFPRTMSPIHIKFPPAGFKSKVS